MADGHTRKIKTVFWIRRHMLDELEMYLEKGGGSTSKNIEGQYCRVLLPMRNGCPRGIQSFGGISWSSFCTQGSQWCNHEGFWGCGISKLIGGERRARGERGEVALCSGSAEAQFSRRPDCFRYG